MIVGCGEWGFREMPMEQHFEIAQKFGFKYLEFGIGGGQTGRLPEAPSTDDVAQFRSLGEKFNIRTPFCCIENDFTKLDASAHDREVERVLPQIQAAADCGATHVRLFAGFTPVVDIDESCWQRLLAAFKTCDDFCQKLDVLISIETHGGIAQNDDGSLTHIDSATTNRDGLRRLVEQLPPRVGFNFDPGNIKAAHPDDRRLGLDLINSRINYCHLKDWRPVGDGWLACAMGDDDLDYAPLFSEMTFDGVYQIEYEPLEDVEDGIQRSLDYLAKVAPGFTLE